MPVSYLLFAEPWTVDSVRAVVRELQAHSESGVGATLGLYEVNRIILAKFDCAAASAEAAAEAAARASGQETWSHPPLRILTLSDKVSIVLEDSPDFAASPLGSDSFGAFGWVAPAPAAPLVPEESVLAPSTLVADPAAAARQMIQVVITRTFGKP